MLIWKLEANKRGLGFVRRFFGFVRMAAQISQLFLTVAIFLGVAGNLVAVQASRISTHLHMAYGEPGQVPGDFYVCPNPFFSFCSRNYMNARTARVLLLILIPGHLLFLYAISLLQGGHTTLTLKFIAVFIFVALIQVASLLYIAEVLTHLVWKRGIGMWY